MTAEGWYRDPFGLHDDRWISAGVPTKLVRDGGRESSDPPPSNEVPDSLIPCDEGPERVDDSRRADEAETPTPNYARAAYASVVSEPIGRVFR